MAAVSLFWNTNMAAVKSCENALYGIVSLNDRTFLRLVTVRNLRLHQRTLNGNVSHVNLNSSCYSYNCTVVVKKLNFALF